MTSRVPSKHPAPTELTTERLLLRRPRPDVDAEQAFAAVDADRQRLGRWLPWVPSIKAVQDERDFLHTVNRWWEACEQFHWLLFTRDTYSYVGMVGAHDVRWDVGVAELGYWLTGESEGRGYMCEAVAAVHAQLFRMGFYRVEIRCAEDNARSAGVPKRLGYRQDGRLRGDRVDGGRRGATLVFSLLADDE